MLKIRCSRLGDIMTGTIGLTDKQEAELKKYYKRDKPLTDRMKERVIELEYKRDNPELSKTCINLLANIEIENRTGRKEKILTKQMEKGIEAEEEAITLISKVTGRFYVKNEEFFENEYITGTPDIVSDIVRDVKCSWNLFSFPHPWTYDLNDQYYWQLQGYMALTGLKEASLDYCLVNAPAHIIEREKNRIMRDTSIVIDEVGNFDYAMDAIMRDMTYNDLPDEKKVYSVPIKRNDNDIKSIYERVELCREFWEENFS